MAQLRWTPAGRGAPVVNGGGPSTTAGSLPWPGESGPGRVSTGSAPVAGTT